MASHARTFAARFATGVIPFLMASLACVHAAPTQPDAVESLYRLIIKFDHDGPALQKIDWLQIIATSINPKLGF